MVHNRRKKNTRHRGSWTHGWGEKKKHRGAGSRGGRGMAGTGKRADTKKPSIAEDPKYFGKFGFVPKRKQITIEVLNLSTLESNLATFVAKKIATKNAGAYDVDLTKSKYQKLLGSGSIKTPVNVTVKFASASAVEKITAAKGSVKVLSEKKE